MAGEAHLYLVASGGYGSSATALANEIWQTGVRLYSAPATPPDPIGTFPPTTFDVVPASIQRTETNWTISGNWTLEGGVNDFDPGDYLNDQAGPAFDKWLKTAGAFSQTAELRELRLYPIGAPDGRVIPAPPYAAGSPCLLTWIGTKPTGASGTMLPPSDSIVASLRTQQVGRRGRGRMYSPPSGTALMGTGAESGTVAAGSRAAIANAYATLMTDLTVNEVFGAFPVVTGAPYLQYALINEVRVGNVMDGQNRRRRQLVETYSAQTVPYEP